MKILFIDTVHPILQQRLEEKKFTCIDASSWTKEKCISALKDIDGIIIRSRFRMDESFLKNAPKIQFIARSGAGMENIDIEYCNKRNIKLFNAPEGNRNAVGEHALGMLLCLFNKIHLGNAQVKHGIWEREKNRGIELDGKTVGIIGFGNNGSAFAKKLRGFDVKVLAYDKYKSGFGNNFIHEVSLEKLFLECDVISFHIPQNKETIYFANDNFFNQFKKPIYLINLSRGKIVQTSALVQALKTGKVLGACLDVLEYEKSSFSSIFEEKINTDFEYLLSSENVLMTPHVGGWTHESYIRLSEVLADKILQVF